MPEVETWCVKFDRDRMIAYVICVPGTSLDEVVTTAGKGKYLQPRDARRRCSSVVRGPAHRTMEAKP